MDPSSIRRLRGPLLRWYRRSRRELPWRRTNDPYAIWVSEIMLQQTRVATVLPYYRRFLERFPDPDSLARAGEEEVLAVWSGLGYYRRARALHRGARAVMRRHGGKLPEDVRALMDLPGVGRYTAGAIASIAFDRPEPALDGNVRRILSRVLAHDGRGARAEARLWHIAGTLALGSKPGALNQALMELGALVCTARSPGCPVCPLRRPCRARGLGDPESYPAPRPKGRVEIVRGVVGWIERGGRVLLERTAAASPLRGTWDLPAVELAAGRGAGAKMRGSLATRHGLTVRVGASLARLSHTIMNRRLGLEVYRVALLRGRVSGRSDLRWMRPQELNGIATSGATRKIFRAVLRDRSAIRRDPASAPRRRPSTTGTR